MKINVFNIKFKIITNPNQPIVMTRDPFVLKILALEIPDNANVKSYIAEWFAANYGAVPTFEWKRIDDFDDTLDDQYPSVNDFAEEIRRLLRRYFECNDNGDQNPEHDPDYTAQNFVDDIHELVGNI